MYKAPIRHHASKKDYTRSSSICTCEFDKDYEIRECLRDYTCKKSLGDDLVVTYDKRLDMPETTWINPIVME